MIGFSEKIWKVTLELQTILKFSKIKKILVVDNRNLVKVIIVVRRWHKVKLQS